jgi:dienelactone hydrolase
VVLILLVGAGTWAAETALLPAHQLRAEGLDITVPAAGQYSVWVWSKRGEAVSVRLGEQQLGEVKPAVGRPDSPVGQAKRDKSGAPTEEFAWTKMKTTADLEAGKKHRLRLGADDHETSVALKEKVGYVLLSRNPDCRPDRLFEVARVFGNRAEAVRDSRVTEFRHKDKTFPIVSYTSKDGWSKRAESIREQILVANGLWPLPEKTPLNAKRFGRIDRDGYSIEKAYFESYPGFYCTGNLYLPRDRKPPYPAILCPHGHWKDGRLADEKDGSVVARCLSFARQGYVVFSPDMVGYNDSKQVAHRARTFASPLWGISLMGLQTWNNIRGIDFLLSIEGVDPERIGCTGASGGGTQTFILAAVDDRVKCAVPVCMVSDYFQGGCECENAPLLRLDTDNIEIAASAAPRPYMITGATGDWTKNIMNAQGPAIRDIYKLFGAENAFNYVIVDAGHNYNKETREHVYRWMGKWLLNETDAEKLREQPYKVEKKEDVLVFTPEHPLPPGSLDEKGVRDSLIALTKKQIESAKPKDNDGLKQFRNIYGMALGRTLFGSELGSDKIEARFVENVKGKTWEAGKMILSQPAGGSQIPALLFTPNNTRVPKSVVVVHPEGKMGLMNSESGEPGSLVTALLDAGYTVLAPDCFLTGEHHTPFHETTRALPKEFPYTYNPTTLSCRVRDIHAACNYMSTIQSGGGGAVSLIGVGAAGPWCLAASATGDLSGRTVVDANGFADADEASWQGDMFQPNILRCGGLRVAGALAAPSPLLIYNTGGKIDTGWIGDVYRVASARGVFRAETDRLSDKAIVDWVTQSRLGDRRAK